jgi:hypothetical protein
MIRHPLAERAARFLYGITGGTLVVRRMVPADSHRVWVTAGRILPYPPLELRLHDTVGGHPAEGGTAVFHLPPVMAPAVSVEHAMFQSRLLVIMVQALEVRISPTDEGADVEVGADLDREVTVGLWMLPFLLLGALLAGAGGVLFLAPRVPPSVPGLDGIPLAFLAAGAGLALLVAVLLWFRWYCRYAVRKAGERLQGMLARLEEEALRPPPAGLEPAAGVGEGPQGHLRMEPDPGHPRD